MLYEHSNICFAKQRIECLAYWFAIYSIHQCRKGFLPRLFFAFCLGSGTEAYWGEAKRCTFWSRLSPEVIDSVLCLGSVRTEAIGDKYFFLKWLPHWLGECDEDHRRWAFQSDGTVKTQTCKHPASESAKTWLKSKKVYTLIGAQMSLAGKAEVQPCPVLFHHGHTLRLSRPRWPPFPRLLFHRRSPHLRQAPTVHRPQTQTNRRAIHGSLRSQSRLTQRARCARGSGYRHRWSVFFFFLRDLVGDESGLGSGLCVRRRSWGGSTKREREWNCRGAGTGRKKGSKILNPK